MQDAKIIDFLIKRRKIGLIENLIGGGLMRKSLAFLFVFGMIISFAGFSGASENSPKQEKDTLIIINAEPEPNLFWKYLKNNPAALDHAIRNMNLIISAVEVNGKRTAGPFYMLRWMLENGKTEEAIDWIDSLEGVPAKRSRAQILKDMGITSTNGRYDNPGLQEKIESYRPYIKAEQERIADAGKAIGPQRMMGEAQRMKSLYADIAVSPDSGMPFAVFPYALVISNGQYEPDYFYKRFGFQKKTASQFMDEHK